MRVPSPWTLTLLLGIASVLLAATGPAAAQNGPDTPRLRHTINAGWRYASGPHPDAAQRGFDDAGWASINLPHTWNATDAFDEKEGYRRGVGWYRKTLRLSDDLEGRRLFLHFEGANQIAEVYVNGKRAGRHVGGYTAFAFDVTELVSLDAPNVIAVRMDNRHHPDVPPLDADFTFYGGIYRDVWLVATDPVHLAVTEHASSGVLVDTPGLAASLGQQGRVRIRSTVKNDGSEAATVELVQRVVDAAGNEVLALRTRQQVASGGTARITQESEPLTDPHLWSPDDPYLYHVSSAVYRDGQLVDRVRNPLGFRWVRATGQDGFFLNGTPINLKGTNRHQDYPTYGNALPNRFHRRDVRIIDRMGANFLRLAHYPQDPVVLDEADRRGLLVWEEIPVVNYITLSEDFRQHAMNMLVEMIHQHYNHPSIVMWGYMNEIMLRPPDPLPEGYYDELLDLTKALEARVQKEDPHRLTVTAQSFHETYNGKGVSDVPDVLGMNLYFGWYYEELEGFGPFLDTLHQQHPARPLLISEYGAGSDGRVHTEAPERFDFSIEYQQRYHESQYRQISERPYLVGSAIWNQYDFGSALRQDTKHAINQKGIYFFDRTPKSIAYYYRAQFSDAPVLHVGPRSWTRRAGSTPADRRQPVVVYTNLDEVELFRNGTSLGTKSVENSTARWTVPFQDGANTLVVCGPHDGRTLTDQLTVHYEDRQPFFEAREAEVQRFAVNAGGHDQFAGDGDLVWEEDQSYPEGPWGYEGGEARRSHHLVFNTSADPLYQSMRDRVQAYRFEVPTGTYEVQLHFLETEYDEPGRRVFDVQVNGTPVLQDLDLAAQYGRYQAVRRRVQVRVEKGRDLVVSFEAQSGTPVVSGLLLRRLP